MSSTPTIPDELGKLRAEIARLKEDYAQLWKEHHEDTESRKELERREARLEKIEQGFYAERDRLRALARRRESAALEKAAHATRIKAIRALADLLPAAKREAAKGKPALLRLILRATR